MDPKARLDNVPWITKEGYFDSTKFPHRQCPETSGLG